jgi:hypothetical protein
MTPRTRLAAAAFIVLGLARPAAAQTTGQPAGTSAPQAPASTPGWARVSFFADGSWSKANDGTTSSFSEVITTVSVRSRVWESGGLEYGLDVRVAGYPSSQYMSTRASLFEGYVGARFNDGRIGFRVGQMWLNDLGALGSIGGGLFESRWPVGGGKLRFRFGAFGGWEPQIQAIKYVSGVHKYGGYAVLEAPNGLRRHVIGYVNIRDSGLTERSVITFQNFVPVIGNNLFFYQAAEYDLKGPANVGSSHLTYFFINGRAKPAKWLELTGTYHRGRSIDTRGITLDQLNGRPINPKALDGYLFESGGGRVSVEVAKGVRLFAGYTRDRNNQDDAARNRWQFGAWLYNVAGSGFDINVTDWRTRQSGQTTYDSWYFSVGRSIVPKLYLTGEFNSSVSTLRLLSNNDLSVVSRPRTHRYAVSGTLRVTRSASVLMSAERYDDQYQREYRIMGGLTFRFGL